jgi:hypothetical protein
MLREEMSIKELLKPKMTRMHDSMKEAIQTSADKHNKGIFDRELRELIRIGLKNREKNGKAIELLLKISKENMCSVIADEWITEFFKQKEI